jgi:hypothetical protein
VSRTCSRLLAAAALVIVRDIQSIIVGGGLVQRLTTSKLPRTKSRNSPLLLMATGLPFTVALNRPGPSWQEIPYPDASVVSKVYAPMAMYAVLDTAPPSLLKLLVDWIAIKVPALSRGIYVSQSFSVSLLPQEVGKTANQQLANRRVHRLFGSGNIRIELSSALS